MKAESDGEAAAPPARNGSRAEKAAAAAAAAFALAAERHALGSGWYVLPTRAAALRPGAAFAHSERSPLRGGLDCLHWFASPAPVPDTPFFH